MIITLQNVWTSLNLVTRGHLRLISSTCIPSDPTTNIWRRDVDRGTPGREEGLRFILVNSRLRGSTMRSSWQTCDFYLERCHSRWEKTMILSTRLKNKKSGAQRRSRKLSNHVSSGRQAISYDKSDRWSSATTDWDSISDYWIIRVSP
jgi:hypothetical protein